MLTTLNAATTRPNIKTAIHRCIMYQVLNGWQNICEPAVNSNKALGTQMQFKPSANIILNASFFIGQEKPYSTKQWRYFHDLYATSQIRPQLKLAAVFDIGAEKRLDTNKYPIW